MEFVILLALLGVHSAWSQECEYAQFSPEHTMCVFKGTGCDIISHGVTQEEIDIIVDVHNQLRNKVATGQTNQPPAANMKQLSWDPELAVIAQRWTDQCRKGHDPQGDFGERRSSHNFEWVNQNYGMMGSTVPSDHADFETHINNWFNEVANMKDSYVASYPMSPPKTIGHYAQVVWADTEKVGCGLIYFKDDIFYKTHLICNYGPGGNMPEDKMYELGPACSQCSQGCSEKYNGLCEASSGKRSGKRAEMLEYEASDLKRAGSRAHMYGEEASDLKRGGSRAHMYGEEASDLKRGGSRAHMYGEEASDLKRAGSRAHMYGEEASDLKRAGSRAHMYGEETSDLKRAGSRAHMYGEEAANIKRGGSRAHMYGEEASDLKSAGKRAQLLESTEDDYQYEDNDLVI